MFKLIILISIIFHCLIGLSQNVLVHNGTYQGKNVYIQNPFASNGVGFSTKDVTVNGEPITNDFVSSAFVIELDKLGLKIGDSVSIHILHDECALPKILNNSALIPKSTCKYESTLVDNDSILKWCTTNENGRVNFIIEQFRWNKWIKLGEVMGNGSIKENCYEYVIDVHSGENMLRIAQENIPSDSETLYFSSNIKPITLLNDKGRFVEFSDSTRFEMYNSEGIIVFKGYGKMITCEKLDPGLYYINYDSKMGEIWHKTFY